MRSGTRSWRRSRKEEADERRRVLAAVRKAQEIVPGYGTGLPIITGDVRRLTEAVGLQIIRAVDEMDSPAVLIPPLNGRYRLVIAQHLHPLVVRHITLHEIGHILAGDIEEPTFFVFSGPLPEAEDVADLFSLVALLDDAECEGGQEYLEQRIREVVPLEDRGWQTYRIPRLAKKVARVKESLDA